MTGQSTMQLLADDMVVLGLVDSINTETVRQALKKNDIQPWIVRSWCIPRLMPNSSGGWWT
jgi:hypothetical protein